MRKGKMIAQGAHASVMNLLSKGMKHPDIWTWIGQGMTKICVRVDSEEELLTIVDEAKKAELTVNLVTDAGYTEFHGVPTNTCAAIGPDLVEEIDKITSELKLL